MNRFLTAQLTKIEDINSKKDYFHVFFENKPHSNNLFIAYFLIYPKRHNSNTSPKKSMSSFHHNYFLSVAFHYEVNLILRFETV